MATFRIEAEEHLQTIAGHLLALDRGLPEAAVREAVESLFRGVHTLKGAARSVALRDVEAICQGLESVLSSIKRKQSPMSREVVGRLQEGMDRVARLLAAGPDAVAAPAPARPHEAAVVPAMPAASAVAPSRPPSAPDTIRVDTARLESLHARAEDFLAVKLSAEERVGEARRLAEAIAGCRQQLGRLNAEGLAAEVLASEARAGALLNHLLGDRRAVSMTVDALLEEARRMRMTPAASVLDTFPRMLDELARTLGKEVELVSEGGELEVDRKVLEAIKDPLLHLARNAVDHGIERPEAREAAGKARRGRIAVSFAALEGRRIEVRVQDDGAGIDRAGLKAGAVRGRLLSAEETDALSEEAALNLTFSSGVSTSPVITALSGHGLGMAIVRDRVERLGGEVLVETVPGAGTTLRMFLPATVVTFRGLLVRAGGQAFLLPMDTVERTVRVRIRDVESAGGRNAIRWNGGAIPAATLAALLGLAESLEAAQPEAWRPCVVIASGTERAAVLVDEVAGEREVLVKEFESPIVRVRHVVGGGVLGTGDLALILRPGDLLRAFQEGVRPARSPQAADEAALAILVVDDSITTRTMERNLLEAAGYAVQVAADGQEAWAALKAGDFDLVLSDVDMPRMDGFDLTARIRADPRLAELPVILVTALESREEKERGIEVGANAYVIKSAFDQSALLEIIGRLA
ncbi:MAG TPA: response regulator [Vicinamibacteria bacterium]|nr:response regulator [Vicinamibacteria bacterium]